MDGSCRKGARDSRESVGKVKQQQEEEMASTLTEKEMNHERREVIGVMSIGLTTFTLCVCVKRRELACRGKALESQLYLLLIPAHPQRPKKVFFFCLDLTHSLTQLIKNCWCALDYILNNNFFYYTMFCMLPFLLKKEKKTDQNIEKNFLISRKSEREYNWRVGTGSSRDQRNCRIHYENMSPSFQLPLF